MSNKTEIAELRMWIALALKDWNSELTINPKLLGKILDQFEAAEARIAELEHEAEREDNILIDCLASMREWRLRAENAEGNYADEADGRKQVKQNYRKLEAELAAMRGEQVPVAWASARSIETKRKIAAFTDENSAIAYGQDNGWSEIIPLFTAPQPAPVVVLPNPSAWSHDGTKYFSENQVREILQSAGITVKAADGEGE